MTQFAGSMTSPPPPPITMPVLSIEQARTLLYWWEEGRKGDGFLNWGAAMSGIQGRWGFIAQDAATWMREVSTPRLLCARDKALLGEDHCVHPTLMAHPVLIYRALNDAERALQMAVTPIPDEVLKAESPEPRAQRGEMPVAAIAVGSIVNTPGGPAEVVIGPDGLAALRMLTTVAPPAPEVQRPKRIVEAPRRSPPPQKHSRRSRRGRGNARRHPVE